jgi:hypothetical protein
VKIYVATSWKNEHYSSVVMGLRLYGHKVHDWRNPPTGGSGFSWRQLGLPYDPDNCSTPELAEFHAQPFAQQGFASDMLGLFWCDLCVLLLPSGNSAHIEAGYAKGQGKKLLILRPTPTKADLMHLMADEIFGNVDSLLSYLAAIDQKR